MCRPFSDVRTAGERNAKAIAIVTMDLQEPSVRLHKYFKSVSSGYINGKTLHKSFSSSGKDVWDWASGAHPMLLWMGEVTYSGRVVSKKT